MATQRSLSKGALGLGDHERVDGGGLLLLKKPHRNRETVSKPRRAKRVFFLRTDMCASSFCSQIDR
jgi:hypothetical protein